MEALWCVCCWQLELLALSRTTWRRNGLDQRAYRASGDDLKHKPSILFPIIYCLCGPVPLQATTYGKGRGWRQLHRHCLLL